MSTTYFGHFKVRIRSFDVLLDQWLLVYLIDLLCYVVVDSLSFARLMRSVFTLVMILRVELVVVLLSGFHVFIDDVNICQVVAEIFGLVEALIRLIHRLRHRFKLSLSRCVGVQFDRPRINWSRCLQIVTLFAWRNTFRLRILGVRL